MAGTGVERFLELERVGRGPVQADVGRQGRGAASKPADDGPERRPLPRAARQSGVDLAEEVVVLDGADPTEQGELVHALGLQWHQLANANAWQSSGDGLERPPVLGGRIGLEVVHVDMAGPAVEDDVNDRLLSLWHRSPGLLTQEVGEREPPQSERPKAEELATRNAITEDLPSAPECEHSANSDPVGISSRHTTQAHQICPSEDHVACD